MAADWRKEIRNGGEQKQNEKVLKEGMICKRYETHMRQAILIAAHSYLVNKHLTTVVVLVLVCWLEKVQKK